MTTPEGRDPAVVLRADVAQYLAGLTAAERATLKLATSIRRDMAGATASINAAAAALRNYAAAAQTVRIPTRRTGSAPVTAMASTAVGTGAAERAARDAARIAAQRERNEQAIARATRQRMQEQSRSVEMFGAAARKSAAGFTTVVRKGAEQLKESLTGTVRTVQVTLAVVTAGLILAAKAAIEWETAWTGVRKTVDGTPEQMAKLEGELRKLATTLPTTHREIAAIAEAAGQMGIARGNIAAFTKTVVDLAATTNLTADEAATGLAKFANVMETLPEKNVRVASTLVALGNAGASTEKDILEMAQRLSGAGRSVGLTEDQVLALSSAMSDLGIEAQLGGGAMQRVLLDLFKAVKGGGDDLEAIAGIARNTKGELMTALDFSNLFNADPSQAFVAVLRGLRQVQDTGGNVVAAMEAVGADGTLDISVLTRMTGALETVNDALDESARAWERPLALLEEAEKRYETTASKIEVARNQLKDIGIDIGGALLPKVAAWAEGFRSTAAAVQQLPGPLGTVALESFSAVKTLALLSTALLVVGARIALAVLVTKVLATTMPRLAAAIGFVQKRFILLAAAIAALGVADVAIKKWTASIDEATGRTADLVELRRSLLDLVDASKAAGEADGSKTAQGIKATGEAARLWGESLKGFRKDVEAASDPSWGDRFNKLSVDILNAASTPLGFDLGTAASDADRYLGRVNDMAEAAKRLDQGFDQALADFVNNGLMAEAAIVIEDFANANQMSLEEVIAIAPKYREAVKAAVLQADVTARANERLAKSGQKAAEGLNAAAIDAETFEKNLKKITPAFLDLDKAQLKNAERWEDIRDEAKKASEALDDVRDSVRDTVSELQAGEASIDSFESALMQLRDTEPDDTGTVDRSLDGFTEAAIRNREAVRGLVDQAAEMIAANIKAGASFDEVAAQTRQYEQYLGGQLTQMGYFGPAVQKMLDPLRQIPGAYQEAQEAASGGGPGEQQLAELKKRVEFGEMLQERLEALRAKNEAAQTDTTITPEVQTQFALQQAQELAAQMEAMGASAEQIAEFTKPIADLTSVTKNGPTVDTSQAKAAQQDLMATGEATRIANEWTAKPKVEADGVKQGLNEITSAVNDFLKSPEGQIYLDAQPKETQAKLRELMKQRDEGVAGNPQGGNGIVGFGRDATKALNWVGTRPLELIPGFASGGYTGPGSRMEPAGTVHKGEFVIDAAKTPQWRWLLEGIQSGRLSPAMFGGPMSGWGPAPGFGSARGPGGGMAVGQWSRGMPNVKLKYGGLDFRPVTTPRRPGYSGGGMVDRYQYASGGYVGGGHHSAPTSPIVNVTAPTSGGGGLDAGQVAGMVAREVRSALNGATVQMDGRAVGNLLIRQADRQSREAR